MPWVAQDDISLICSNFNKFQKSKAETADLSGVKNI